MPQNKRTSLFVLSLICVILLGSCSKEDSEIMVLVVAPQKSTYSHPVGGMLLGYEVTNEKGETFVVLNINGFEKIYEKGYEYKIRVKRIRTEIRGREPYQDEIDNTQYYLLEILEKKKK